MSADDIDALLERMPKIADAVNAFSSETVQQEAFVALIAAFNGRTARTLAQALPAVEEVMEAVPVADDGVVDSSPLTSSTANNKKTKKPKPNKGDWTLVKELDLHPVGKVSFEEFANEKQAKSMEDRYALVVYYLQEILGINPVTKNEVGTVFRVTSSWQEPSSVQAGLRTAQNRKATIICSNMDDISVTPIGRNFIERKLPAKGVSK